MDLRLPSRLPTLVLVRPHLGRSKTGQSQWYQTFQDRRFADCSMATQAWHDHWTLLVFQVWLWTPRSYWTCQMSAMGQNLSEFQSMKAADAPAIYRDQEQV